MVRNSAPPLALFWCQTWLLRGKTVSSSKVPVYWIKHVLSSIFITRVVLLPMGTRVPVYSSTVHAVPWGVRENYSPLQTELIPLCLIVLTPNTGYHASFSMLSYKLCLTYPVCLIIYHRNCFSREYSTPEFVHSLLKKNKSYLELYTLSYIHKTKSCQTVVKRIVTIIL